MRKLLSRVMSLLAVVLQQGRALLDNDFQEREVRGFILWVASYSTAATQTFIKGQV